MDPAPVTLFTALANETRLRCLVLLARHGELCVCDLTAALGLSQPHVSRHLAQLREAGWVQDRRDGVWVYYRIAPDVPPWALQVLAHSAGGLAGQFPFAQDDLALTGRPRSGPARCATRPTDLPSPIEDSSMTEPVYNVLFLCTGNSARSIIGECLINRLGRGTFRGFSAGSHPKGEVHPLAIEVLRRNNYLTEGLRSKDWTEFSGTGAPVMDFVFTVCDNAAAEVCPVWPGQPMTAHWGIADPAAAEGDQVAQMMAFRQSFRELEHRVEIFVSLPLASLDRLKLQQKLDDIGRSKVGAEAGAAA
jgi:protein-tyrosine-phosphatase/DNA-binding transcriptional ArsR family regulator